MSWQRRKHVGSSVRPVRAHMIPDDPQQRRTLIIQLALIAAIITIIAIVAVSRY
jgi:hypothetical protein